MVIDSDQNQFQLTKSERNKIIFFLILLLLVSFISIAIAVIIFILNGPAIVSFIASPLIIIFSFLLLLAARKYFLDLKNNRVIIISGTVNGKDENGGDNPVYSIGINGVEHHVSPFLFGKVKEGDKVNIRKAEFSKKVLSVEVLNRVSFFQREK